jgi:hypothetical protein
MTCEQCLAALATESLREMTPDSPVMQHCATCPDCARVTTMVRDKEYETATILNALPPMSSPLVVAEAAVRTAKRRRTGRVVVTISGLVGAAIIWIAAAQTIIPALNRADMEGAKRAGSLRTETIPLTCLSPQQAADIINPYVRSHGSTYYLPSSGLSVITVRATRPEILKSRDLIAEFEKNPAAACRAPATSLLKPGEGFSVPESQGGTARVPVSDKVAAPAKKQ